MSPAAVLPGALAPRQLQPSAPRITRAADLHLGPAPPVARVRSADPTVTVVIPTLNEAGNVTPVILGMPSCVSEIIVVDGRSTDDTVAVALAADSRVRVVMEQRKGKGVAMLTGFAAARCDVIVAIDADGSMDPGELELFRTTLALGYDLVKGSREAVGGGSEDFSPIRRVGNAALTRLANRLHGTRWSDMCYGYFGFWRDVLPRLELPLTQLTTRALAESLQAEAGETAGADKLPYGSGFEIETLLFLRAARSNLQIAEVPSREYPRNLGDSNLRTMRDGTRVLAAIGRERVRRTQAPSQMTAGIVGSPAIAGSPA